MKIVSLLLHPTNLNDGSVILPTKEGDNFLVARISSSYEGDGLLRRVVFGKPEIQVIAPDKRTVLETRPLPPIQDGVFYVVSGLMAKAAVRPDFYAPATGHPDAVREGSIIKSVPFLVQE